MYIFQMNDGRFHVDAYTRAPQAVRMAAMRLPGFDTRAEAEAAMNEAKATVAA